MSGHRPRWADESPRADEIVRLTDREYRVALASAAQRAAGALACAIDLEDRDLSDALLAALHELTAALGPTGPATPKGLVANQAVRVSAGDPALGARLFVGGAPSLWDGLRPILRDARQLDVVVAYSTVEGVRLLREFLEREAPSLVRLRLLTGCYLGGTRPEALRALLELFRGSVRGEDSVVRFVADPARHFHPKAYRVVDPEGRVHLVVGSSNLSRTALDGHDAVEWNVMFDVGTSAALVHSAERHLDRVFANEGVVLTDGVVAEFERTAQQLLPPSMMLWDRAVEAGAAPVQPTPAQGEALARLEQVRAEGSRRALVVAATGLGKTILAALDTLRVSPPGSGRSILFVAHREELLTQARRAMERVRGPGETHGLVNQYESSTHADVVYASVFSLGKLTEAELDRFDYVVIDEAHHAAAKSYRRLLRQTENPNRFVLGLTATPERQDGGDIFALFDGVVAYEKHLLDAIEAGWLSPFHYFGVPDTVDYRDLEWVGGALGYREAELEAKLLDDRRMAHVLSALAKPGRGGKRTLFFCVSVAHARHTVAALRAAAWKVARVDSAPDADDRKAAIARLRAATIDAVVAVDMFNEGLDVPELDRVVCLRPTDSRTIFLQQLGRGLRLSDGKTHLTVVDLVGNHRRAQEHLTLLGVSSGALLATPNEVSFVARIGKNEFFIEPEAVEAIKAVGAARTSVRSRLVDVTRELSARAREDGAELPRARLLEVLTHTGLTVATVRALFGSWRELLVEAECALASDAVDAETSSLFEAVESTSMAGPHKMLLLGAMATRGAQSVSVADGATWMRDELRDRHAGIRLSGQDGERLVKDGRPHGQIPREYPMGRLAGAHARHFEFADDQFSIRAPRTMTPTAFAGVGERAEARLYDFARRGRGTDILGTIIPQGSAGLGLELEADARRVGARDEWVRLEVGSDVVFGKVMKIAINVIHRQPSEDGENLATEILTRASEAGSREEARRRTLRLTPAAAGGFALELYLVDSPSAQRAK